MKYQCSRRSSGSCKRSAHFAGLAAYLARPLLLSSHQSSYGYFSSPSLALFYSITSRSFDRTSCPYYPLFRSCESPLRPSLEVASPSVRPVECCVSISSVVRVFRKTSDPSPRTKGFSHSLMRTDGGPSLGCYPGSVHASSICSRSTAGNAKTP
jgi:hypothetical protein